MGGSRLRSLGMVKTEKSRTSRRCRGKSSGLKPIWCCSASRSELPAACCAADRSDAQYADSALNDGAPCVCLERSGETGKQAGRDALAARELRLGAGNGVKERRGCGRCDRLGRLDRWNRWGKRGTPEGEERGVRVEGLDGDGVLKERRGAFLPVRRVPRGYEGNRLPERSVQEEEGDPRVDAAEADDAVSVERVGGAGKHGFPAVFAEKRPLELGGKELPNVEEIVSSSRDTR